MRLVRLILPAMVVPHIADSVTGGENPSTGSNIHCSQIYLSTQRHPVRIHNIYIKIDRFAEGLSTLVQEA